MSTKKYYEPELKAKVAIEAIKNQKGTAEICSDYKVPATNLYDWRDKLLTSAKELFISENEAIKRQKLFEQEIANLHKVIGELTVENNFLKKKFMK